MRTLLLVDDHPGVLLTLHYLVSSRAYRTLRAKSGGAALELARAEPVHAALIDVHMPGMDGFVTCEALRARAGAAAFPVWLMTGAYCAEAAQRAREVGAVTLLSKPFDTDSLLREMEARWATPSSSPAVASDTAIAVEASQPEEAP